MDGGSILEVLPVFLRNGVLHWLRPPGAPSIRIGGDDGHPGETATRSLTGLGLTPVVVHSTSWRHQGDRVVLTYLGVVEDPGAPAELEVLPVARQELARGSATGPPVAIDLGAVVEHGLRHLAWLVKDDRAIGRALGEPWERALHGYEPEPFRSLA